MDGQVASFGVNVQALVDLADLLREQLDEIERPVRAAGEINDHPELPLASFAEAFSLSDDHAQAAAGMVALLAKLGQATEFAATASRIVAERYQTLSAAGEQNIAAADPGTP